MGESWTGEEGARKPEHGLRKGEPRLPKPEAAIAGITGKNFGFPKIDLLGATQQQVAYHIIEIASHQGAKTEDEIVEKIVAVLTEIAERRANRLAYILNELSVVVEGSMASRLLNDAGKMRLQKALDEFIPLSNELLLEHEN